MAVASQGAQPESFEQDFQRRISGRGRLSPNDMVIARHIRLHLDEVPFQTADQVAEDLGLSRAAVVRLALKLGYEGFAELRERAREDLRARRTSPVARFSPQASAPLLERKLWQDGENLQRTQRSVAEPIMTAAQLLCDADRVYVAGHRKSHPLAAYAQRLLHGIRPGVDLIDPSFPDVVADATPADVLLAIIFQRYSRQTLQIIEQFTEVGAATIVLTDGFGPQVVQQVTCLLPTHTDSPLLYQSMVAPLAVLEMLAANVAALNPIRARGTLTAVERLHGDSGVVLP